MIISNDGNRVASYSLTDTRSEVIIYDTNRGKALCNHTYSGATTKCQFTDADNTLYLSSISGLAIIDTSLGQASAIVLISVATDSSVVVLQPP